MYTPKIKKYILSPSPFTMGHHLEAYLHCSKSPSSCLAFTFDNHTQFHQKSSFLPINPHHLILLYHFIHHNTLQSVLWLGCQYEHPMFKCHALCAAVQLALTPYFLDLFGVSHSIVGLLLRGLYIGGNQRYQNA
jgi:hypothetical protein